ncbi:unnamed protein product [Gordionus sp. m RMFG-2023]
MLIGRTLGFIYEVDREDRKDYIIIDLNKIDPIYGSEISETINADDFNISYEYGSVMHFYPDEFKSSRVEGPTFITKDLNYQATIGSSIEPSFYDLMALNKFYCNDSCKEIISYCNNFGYPNPSDCDTCICPSVYGGQKCQDSHEDTEICSSEISIQEINEKANPISIHSPGWPDKNYQGDNCNWIFKAKCSNNSMGKLRIEINATNFDILKATTGQCIHWLEIKYKKDQAMTGLRFCGTMPNIITLDSEWENLAISFQSDIFPNFLQNQSALFKIGFEATVTLVPNSCDEEKLRENNMFTPWSNWSPCSEPCGGCGIQKRIRKCLFLCYDQKDCPCRPVETEYRDCNPYLCDITTKYDCFISTNNM